MSKPRVLNQRTDKIPPDAVYVGRHSKWGNPFEIGRPLPGSDGHGATREEVIAEYRSWLLNVWIPQGALNLDELRGKALVCWCAPLPCHADVLLELANRQEVITE